MNLWPRCQSLVTSINGSATARGHTVDIDESFIEIVEKSDSLMALMGYFEARKGPFALFTDVVWADLTFDGERRFDINRTVSGNPFARLPDFNVTIKGNLDVKANAEVDYRSTIVQFWRSLRGRQMGLKFDIVHRPGRSGWCTLCASGHQPQGLVGGCSEKKLAPELAPNRMGPLVSVRYYPAALS